MSTEALTDTGRRGAVPEGPFSNGPSRHDVGLYVAEGAPGPTVGMVLHRVFARSARTFLLNDMNDELVNRNRRVLGVSTPGFFGADRPLWAQIPRLPVVAGDYRFDLAGVDRHLHDQVLAAEPGRELAHARAPGCPPGAASAGWSRGARRSGLGRGRW